MCKSFLYDGFSICQRQNTLHAFSVYNLSWGNWWWGKWFIENIQLVLHHAGYYDNNSSDDFNTLNTSWINKVNFTTPGTTIKEKTSSLRLRQKVKQGKLAALYRHLNVKVNLDLSNLDWCKMTTDPIKGAAVSSFTMVINTFLWQNQQVSFLHQKH